MSPFDGWLSEQISMSRRARWISVLVGLALYTAALFFPVTRSGELGWELVFRSGLLAWELLAGQIEILGFFSSAYLSVLIWTANPALLVASISLIRGQFRFATVSATIGVLLTWGAFLKYSSTVAQQPGFWCWSLSMMWIALISLKPALQRDAPLPPQNVVVDAGVRPSS